MSLRIMLSGLYKSIENQKNDPINVLIKAFVNLLFNLIYQNKMPGKDYCNDAMLLRTNKIITI